MYFEFLRKFYRRLVLAILCALTPGMAAGQGYFQALFTESIPVAHARNSGLGGVVASRSQGGLAALSNPAWLTTSGLEVNLGWQALTWNEDRSFPVIDQFGDQVTDNIYVVSRNLGWSVSAGVKARLGALGWGVATAPFQLLVYDYNEEVRGSLSSSHPIRDPLVGYHRVQRTGLYQQIALGVAWHNRRLRVGLSGKWLTARDLQFGDGVVVLDPDAALASDTTTFYIQPVDLVNAPLSASLGLVWSWNPHLELSFLAEGGWTIQQRQNTALPLVSVATDLPAYGAEDSVTVSYHLPPRFTAGARIRPRRNPPVQIVAELSYSPWNWAEIEFDQPVADTTTFPYAFRESWTGRLGAETRIAPGTVLRVGFAYETSPLAEELTRSVFSVGGGYRNGPWQFDLGGEWWFQRYHYPDLFVPPGDPGHGLEQVRESWGRLNATLSYHWRL